MRIYWTTTTELAKANPSIFGFNLKAEGMFIGAPGTLIFRTRQEALDAIKKAKEAIRTAEIAQDFDNIFYDNKEN